MTGAAVRAVQVSRLAAKPHLIDACAAWDFAEWGCHMPQASLALTVESFRRSTASEGLPLVLVACAGSAPAGMVSLVARDHPDHDDLGPWLSALYVHPRFRRRGVARLLCRRVVAEAAAGGHRRIHLYTATARALYEGLGWRAVGTVAGPTGLAEALMVLSLD